MPGSHSSGSDSYPSPCCCFRMSPDRAPETRFAFLHKKLVNILKAYKRTFSWKGGFKKPVSVTCSRRCGSRNLSAQVNASGQDSRKLSMYRRSWSGLCWTGGGGHGGSRGTIWPQDHCGGRFAFLGMGRSGPAIAPLFSSPAGASCQTPWWWHIGKRTLAFFNF